MVRRLGDLGTLHRIGFSTTFGHLKVGLSEDVDRVLAEADSWAHLSITLVCNILRCRGASMFVHRSWPMLFALFASDIEEDRVAGLALLRQQHAEFSGCQRV